MPQDAIALCSAALVLVGEEPIASFEDAGTAGVVASARYQPLADLLMASHPWHWTEKLARLSQLDLSPAPSLGFTAACALPEGCFRVLVPLVSSQPCDSWRVQNGVIYVDAGPDEVVELIYHGRVTEDRFPPGFATALTYRLASDFAVPVAGDEKKRDLYLRDSERELAKARHTESNDQPADPIRMGRFQGTRAWR